MNIRSFFLEQEQEKPSNWVTNIILIRDGKGNVISQEIEDDPEEEE